MNINVVLSIANKLRDVGRPLEISQIVGKIINSLPESFARVRSGWQTTPIAERTIETLQKRLIAEERDIEAYKVEIQRRNANAFLAAGKHLRTTLIKQNVTRSLSLCLIGQNVASGSNQQANYYGNSFQNPLQNYPAPGFQQTGRGGYLHGVRGGRIDKHRGTRGGFAARGRGGFQNNVTFADNSWQEFTCLFCQVCTHNIADCRKMSTARENMHARWKSRLKSRWSISCLFTRRRN